MINAGTLNLDVSSVFDNLYSSINIKTKIYVLRGGTRSSKTISILQMILLWLITGKFGEFYLQKGVCSIVRKYAATLKNTVMRDFKDLISMNGLSGLIHENKTDKIFTYRGRIVEFIGADDAQKLKGGKRDILYCNEGNELDFKTEFFQLNIRTKYFRIIDFNPDDEDTRINTEIEQKRATSKGDVKVIVSTYLDNPFLTDEEVEEIEMIKDQDPFLWQVYGKGEYGKIKGLVYPNYELIDELPEEAKYVGDGLDFGFSKDPAAFVGCYKWNGGIILHEILYQRGLTNPELDEQLKNLVVKSERMVVADSSEPKSIQELKNLGRAIEGAVKGPDSVKYGIKTVKKFKLYITKESGNIRKEIKKYRRRTDKNGNELNEPVDFDNHAMDAARYIITSKLGAGNKRAFVMDY